MPSTPLICCSSGTMTLCSTTWALAPLYVAETWTVGGEMSGYWATGSFVIPNTPSRTMITEMTVLRTGCVIKLFSIFLRLFGVAVEAVCVYRPGDHHCAVPQVEAIDKYPVATFEAVRYHKEFTVIGGCRGDRHRDDL